jgi:hypothetical protein
MSTDQDAIVRINDVNCDAFLNAERAALIFTRNDCGSCSVYLGEVKEARKQGRLKATLLGEVVLDDPGALGIERRNPWLSQLEFLPYALFYKEGEKVDDFAASEAGYLLERIKEQFSMEPTS